MLWEVTKQIEGHTICALGDAAAWPVQVRNSLCMLARYLLGMQRSPSSLLFAGTHPALPR